MVDGRERYREIGELSDELSRCGRCGFCQSVCPVYQVSADECGVARGRNMFASNLISGRVDISAENRAFLSECLLCRACVDACFSHVKTDEVVLAGRRSRARLHGISPIRAYMFDRVLGDHKKMGQLIRLASRGRMARIDKLVSALDTFGWFGPSVTRAEELTREIPKRFLRERLTGRETSRRGLKRVVFFIGCGINFMFPDAGEASINVLEKLGFEVTVMDHGCCGLPAYAHGDIAAARQLALANMQALSSDRDCAIVTDCSSCASFLKDYPRLLSHEPTGREENHAQAQRFSARVRDMVEILANEDVPGRVAPAIQISTALQETVTFHEPCHLGRYQGIRRGAREILRSLPGIEFVEMPESDWCCGGAGTFAVEHPQLSLGILERKLGNVISCAADTVVTTCPSCMMQIRSGLIRTGETHRVRHLTEIVRGLMTHFRPEPPRGSSKNKSR